MNNRDDAFRDLMRDAERRVINAGIRGGNAHAEIDQATIMMATMSWAVREIKNSNEKMIREVRNGNGGNSTKDRIKRNAPAAGLGAGIVALVQMIRELLSG